MELREKAFDDTSYSAKRNILSLKGTCSSNKAPVFKMKHHRVLAETTMALLTETISIISIPRKTFKYEILKS